MPREEADVVLRGVVKRLREANPRVSETLLYVAGLRSLSQYADDSARRTGLGKVCSLTVREWREGTEAIHAEMAGQGRERVRAGIESLPDELREIHALLVLENHSYPEIASRLGLSTESVRAQVFRAKEILRGRFGALLMGSP